MQPDLVLNEEQRKERFSESLNRKKLRTEHASVACLPSSKPIATVAPFLESSIPRMSIFPIVPQGSETMEKDSKLESLVTSEYLGVNGYKPSGVPEKVSVIIRGPTTNGRRTIHYDENDTLENNNTVNGNDEEQCNKNITSEPPLKYITSLEDGQNLEMSEETKIPKMIFPQNHNQIPQEDFICETMETFFENTNDVYIDINFAELTDDIESPSPSKFQHENLGTEDNMEYEATSNSSSKHQQSSDTSEDIEETTIILKYVHKKSGQMELKKQKYSESNSDSPFSLKENQSIENR